jgi:hypothetical protein
MYLGIIFVLGKLLTQFWSVLDVTLLQQLNHAEQCNYYSIFVSLHFPYIVYYKDK